MVRIRRGQRSRGKKYVSSFFPSLSLFFSIGKYSLGNILNENHTSAMGQHNSHFILIPAYILATKSQEKWCSSYCQPGVQDSDSTHGDINK